MRHNITFKFEEDDRIITMELVNAPHSLSDNCNIIDSFFEFLRGIGYTDSCIASAMADCVYEHTSKEEREKLQEEYKCSLI